jgi:hypothetical protein
MEKPQYSALDEYPQYRTLTTQELNAQKAKRFKIFTYATIAVGGLGLVTTIVFIILYARAYQIALKKKQQSAATANVTSFKKKKSSRRRRTQQAEESRLMLQEANARFEAEQWSEQTMAIPQFLPMGDDSGMSEL